MDDFNNNNNNYNASDDIAAKKKLLEEPFTSFDDAPRYPGTTPPVYDSSTMSMSGLESNDSQFMELMKGILGAIVGCIPGFILWILVGRLGVLAAICGALLAGGAVGGYIFMTRDGFLEEKYCAFVCIGVCIVAIYLAQRIVFCWVLSDNFSLFRQTMIETYNAFSELTDQTPQEIEKSVDDLFLEKFGFIEGKFSNFFFNFSKVKNALGLGGSFNFRLLESYLFGILGGIGIFKKTNH
ncbi:MAG: hypothetical protein J5501_01435 [Ruminococcus sp.]|nr:hypothetical protein [Ruminococcus sp.]